MSMMWGLKQIGAWKEQHGTNVLDTGAPFYDTYETKDGKYVSLGSLEPQFYAELLAAARSRRRRAARADGPRAVGTRCATRFTELFKTKTRAEWDELLLGSRRVLRARAHDERGDERRAHARPVRRSSSATACRSRRPRRASRAPRARCSVRRRGRASTPTRRSPTGGSRRADVAKLREAGAVA